MATLQNPNKTFMDVIDAYFKAGFETKSGQDYDAYLLADFIRVSHQLENSLKLDSQQCQPLDTFLQNILETLSKDDIQQLSRADTLKQILAHTIRLFFADSLGRDAQNDFYAIWQLAQCGDLTLPQRYYLYWQLTILQFTQHRLHTAENRVALQQLYTNIYHRFRPFIAPFRLNKRLCRKNSNTIVILTNQFLQHQHAPTRVCMEYAHALKTQLGYNVIVINTADLTTQMEVPFYHGLCGHYVEDYRQTNHFRVGQDVFPFTQLQAGLLQADEAECVLEAIEQIDPVMILALGGASIMADLCGEITRVVSVDYSLSLPISLNTQPVQQGHFSEISEAVCAERGIEGEAILKLPAYCIPPETLPKVAAWDAPWREVDPDAFVLTIVGNRLNIEVSDDLLDKLEQLFTQESRLRLALIGPFQVESHHTRRWPVLFSRAHALGFDKQFTRFYPSVHVFLNPPRLGGGTSGAFALEAGLPVLCLALENGSGGDIGGVAGPDNVLNWETCSEKIRLWLNDSDAYAKARSAARTRYDEINDFVTPLRQVIDYGLAT